MSTVDGKYVLTRGEDSVTLELAAGVVTLSGPSGTETLATGAEAKRRFDAALLEKMNDGWEIADMETSQSRADAKAEAAQRELEATPEPPEEEADEACTMHDGVLVVNLDDTYDREDLTLDHAVAVLRAAGCGEAQGIYIHETMAAGFEAHGETWYSSVDPWCAAVGLAGAPACRDLVVDTEYQSLTRQASAYCGDLTGMLASRGLERVYIAGFGLVSALEAPSLVELRFIGEGLEAETVAAVLGAQAPKLETLALGLAYEHGAKTEALEALIAGLEKAKLPQLRELVVATSFVEDHATLLTRLAKTTLVKQLETLTFDGGSNADEDDVLAALLDAASSLGHLRRFAVSRDVIDTLMDDQLARVSKALPVFEVATQQSPDPFTHPWLPCPDVD